MTEDTHPHDPRGLIREAYRIEGIGLAEVRAIFLDWAMTRPDSPDECRQLADLYAFYAAGRPDHPMSDVLRLARDAPAAPKGRRGGARGRRG